MTSKRRLLFITDVTPLPLDRGQRVRVSNLVAACRRVFAVTFVGLPPEEAPAAAQFEEGLDRTIWVGAGSLLRRRHDPGVFWRALRAAPGVRRPASVRAYLPFAAALRTVDMGDFDLVWAERPHMARLCGRFRGRTVLDLDDIEHVRIRQHLALARPWRLSASLLGEMSRYLLYRRMELRWSRGFRATVVCSERDRHYLVERGCRNVRVVPNGVNDAGTASARDGTTRPAGGGPLRVVFLGNMAHPPNLDAVAFFVGEVLPSLRAADPAVTFDVLGPPGDPLLMRSLPPGARFRGFVPDLAAGLAEYDVFVAPIRYGSGTRVKLLDAMACGIPVVTTAAGADGLDVEDGEHVLIASDARGLADKVLAVKNDPALGGRLATNARRLVDLRYRSAAIQDDVAAWLAALAGDGG